MSDRVWGSPWAFVKLWIGGSLEPRLCGLLPTMATLLIWHMFLLISFLLLRMSLPDVHWHTQNKVMLCAHTHMNTIVWYHSPTLTKLQLNRTSGWQNLISPWREIILHRHESVPETPVKPSGLKREKCHLSGIKHPQLQLRPWNMHCPDTYFSHSA